MSERSDIVHTARNNAATVLANVEYLRMLFEGADPARPLLEQADEATRRDVLTSLEATHRAVRSLMQALRSMDG